MIIFYKQTKSEFKISDNSVCNAICSSTCSLKPKSKCCNKFKKKGINCKRCPHILLQKAS